MTDELIHHEADVSLRDPVLIAAFRGWNDAGDAASFAAQHLARDWSARKHASIDPEGFYDFQAVRPQVRLIDGMTREITWPANDFFVAQVPGAERDAIILVGTEPSTRWRTFSRLVVDLARAHHVGLVITFGALLADVPHSRPVPITGTAVSPDLVKRLGLQPSRYEGPTGIVGVIHDACARAGIESASLWAAVPHYLAVTPNPKAALALVTRVVDITGLPADVEQLERAGRSYDERVAEIVASDEDVQAYVHMLEDRLDGEEPELDPSQIPSGEDLAAELERFLQDGGQDPS